MLYDVVSNIIIVKSLQFEIYIELIGYRTTSANFKVRLALINI
jgi:hypothetical protein